MAIDRPQDPWKGLHPHNVEAVRDFLPAGAPHIEHPKVRPCHAPLHPRCSSAHHDAPPPPGAFVSVFFLSDALPVPPRSRRASASVPEVGVPPLPSKIEELRRQRGGAVCHGRRRLAVRGEGACAGALPVPARVVRLAAAAVGGGGHRCGRGATHGGGRDLRGGGRRRRVVRKRRRNPHIPEGGLCCCECY